MGIVCRTYLFFVIGFVWEFVFNFWNFQIAWILWGLGACFVGNIALEVFPALHLRQPIGNTPSSKPSTFFIFGQIILLYLNKYIFIFGKIHFNLDKYILYLYKYIWPFGQIHYALEVFSHSPLEAANRQYSQLKALYIFYIWTNNFFLFEQIHLHIWTNTS